MTRHARRCPRPLVALVLLVGLSACGSRTAPPPEPGTQRGTPPDIRGRTAMILPVQQQLGIPGDLDAELLFGLSSRGSDIEWVSPDALARALERSPSLSARTRGLPVGQFLSAEVLRIGDPLFGELYRLSSLVGAQAAVLPVQGVLVQDIGDPDPRVRLTVALIETRSGIVSWFGILEGEAYPVDDPRLLASAVDEVARTLLWYVATRPGPDDYIPSR